MCGIAGILQFNGKPIVPQQIEAMTDAIAHRGRDSAATVIGGMQADGLTYPGIALGHRRLSVIDLQPTAAQPMYSADRRMCIVYNGELYNYRELRTQLTQMGCVFHTGSDTEVLLAAYAQWGEECLKKFNGMFAFAIWNENNQSLFCARDALGIKPFYYKLDSESLCFSSESQALVDEHVTLSPSAVTSYFFSMYVPRQLSIYAGIEKLLPGQSLQVFPDGRVLRRNWWTLPGLEISTSGPAEAAERLQSLLDRAVTAQLQSDVPLGALLSGGFDSGMIVASAAKTASQLHTYSVGFNDGHQFSELPIASALAQRYGTIHHERVIASNEVMTMLDAAIAGMSEPVADSAMVPTWCLSKMAADDGVKVLLSGTGGDEVFAGYPRYVASSWRRQALYRLPAMLRRALGNLLSRNGTLGARLMNPALDMVLFTGSSTRLAACTLPGNDLSSFMEYLVEEVYPQPRQGASSLYQNMEFDLQVYLPDLLLMLLDQLTMTHTVEGRVPLLDVDLISASYALQAELHATPANVDTRKLMRHMAKGRLDNRTFSARKQGFSGPVRSWIENNRDRFREVTMSAAGIPGLEHVKPERWWAGSAAESDPYWAQEVFMLYCFTTWYQTHVGHRG